MPPLSLRLSSSACACSSVHPVSNSVISRKSPQLSVRECCRFHPSFCYTAVAPGVGAKLVGHGAARRGSIGSLGELGYLAWKDWLRVGFSYRSERSMKVVFAAGGDLEVASWQNCGFATAV